MKTSTATNDDNSILRQEIQQLKSKLATKEQREQNQSTSTGNDNTNLNIQKNLNTPQNLNKGTTPDINEILKYIENTMQTLNEFTKQLTQQQNTTQTLTGM